MNIRDVVRINELNINSKYPYSEIEYIDTSSVTEGRFEKLQYIQLKDAPSRAKRIVRHKDILISTVRPNLKHYGIVRNPSNNTIASTGFAVITCKKVCPDYLYRILTTNWYTDFLSGIAESQQSNYPAFNPSLIENTNIKLPPLPVQRKIAAVLSAYDDLIENNNRRIAILERMAEELYREWFVRLRFPGHEKTKITKGIPEGWKIKGIDEVSMNYDGKRIPLAGIDREKMKGSIPYYGAAKIIDYIDKYIFDGKYLLIAEDGSVITSEGYPVLQLVNEKFWVNNHTHVLTGANEIYSTEWLYLSLIKYPIIGQITGAAQPKITQANLNKINLLTPTEEILIQFNKNILSIFELINNTLKQNTRITTARDRLLSRLMSGKIDVENLDIQFPASMKEDEEVFM